MLRSCYILTLTLSVLLSGCTRNRADETGEESASPAAVVPVKASKVWRGNIAVTVTVTGKTDVLRKEKILAPTSGKIISLSVLEFQEVHAGDVLAVIRTKESQAAIDGAGALLQSAENPKQKADAEKALKLASALQSSTVVRATLDGVVSVRTVAEGEIVSENSELLTIIDPQMTIFMGNVPLQDVKKLRKGEGCAVYFPALPGVAFAGIVDGLSPQADLQSQTVGLRVRFTSLTLAAESLLRPEMIGTAIITSGIRRGVLLVSKAALVSNDEKNSYSLITVTGDSLSKSVSVRVGEHTDSTAEVIGDGLWEGMTVLTEGNYSLPDSTKVIILP